MTSVIRRPSSVLRKTGRIQTLVHFPDVFGGCFYGQLTTKDGQLPLRRLSRLEVHSQYPGPFQGFLLCIQLAGGNFRQVGRLY